MPRGGGRALAGALAAACLAAAPSPAAAVCGWPGYSYAGLESANPVLGVAATISSLRAARVESGHVAAWVGVGGEGAGPGGSDEWIQVGLTATPGSAQVLYYEIKRPGEPLRYVPLAHVQPGEPRRVAVLAVRSRPDHWRVWVGERPVGPPVFLPGSRAWTAVATAESWDGGSPACNRYAFRFDRVAVATEAGGSWQTLRRGYVVQDRGYRVVRRSTASFLAISS
jgi:hypothetical protein